MDVQRNLRLSGMPNDGRCAQNQQVAGTTADSSTKSVGEPNDASAPRGRVKLEPHRDS